MSDAPDNGTENSDSIDEKLRQRGRVEIEPGMSLSALIRELGLESGDVQTDEQRAWAREHVKAELRRRGWTVAVAARRFQVPKSDIRAALVKTARIDPDPVLRLLLQKIHLEPARDPAAPGTDRFAEISLVEDVHATVSEGIDLCRAGTPFMSLVTGPAGCGKSLALRGIAQYYLESVYLCVNEATVRKLPFLGELARRLGLSEDFKTSARAFQAIVGKLKGTYRLLVFDELHLVTKRLLNVIREIMDATECPIVLAGQPELETMLFAGRGDKSRGATVYRRVGPKLNVEDLTVTRTTRGPDGRRRAAAQRSLIHTREDVCRVIESLKLNIRIAPDALERLVWIANYPEGGMLGTLIGLVSHCVRANPGVEVITEELLGESLRRWNTIGEFQQIEHLMRADPLATRIKAAGARSA